MELLSLKNIGKTYDEKPVLKHINLSIEEGEFFTFLGPSGCGKTTLLRIVAGFVQPEKGQVIFNHTDITKLAAEKRNVGMVFQNYALFPFMSVYENVAYGLKVQKDKKKVVEAKVRKYLKLVNLEGYEKRNVSALSGGEQQRVALARSLVMEPQLLLLDEPLSNLDARLRDKMRMELKEIQRALGITTIFVTHDQTEALTMSDRIAVFDQGNCVQVGTPHEIYAEPLNAFVADFIGETNLLKGKIDHGKFRLNDKLVLDVSSHTEGNIISIRPQDILLQDKLEIGSNCLMGKLKKMSISGHLIEYTVTVDGVDFKVIRMNGYADHGFYTLGQSLYISIDPRCIKIFNK